MTKTEYVLITPAKNEENYIGKTIDSVINQTKKPLKWIIVDDGSSDQTSVVVSKHIEKHDFIHFINNCGNMSRSFGSKVKAFKAGFRQLGDIQYDFIGNLDADVTFEEKYFEDVINLFSVEKKLGIAGGIIRELINGKYVEQNTSLDSVAGAVQLFRKQCFQQIGGYREMKYGGVDTVAEVMARMNGWKVQTISELKVLHHRQVGLASIGSNLKKYYSVGFRHFTLGYHPLFILMLSMYRMKEKPYLFSGLSIIAGYISGVVVNEKKVVSEEYVQFLRKEQIGKIKHFWKKIVPKGL